MIGVLLFLAGLVLGGAIYRIGVVHYPGRPVQQYEQALYIGNGQLQAEDGPTWLSIWKTYTLRGIYDVSDRAHSMVVEPAYCYPGPNSEPGIARQRFYAELTIVWHPVDMRLLLSLGDDFESWLESRVKTALRTRSLTRTWDLYDDGTDYRDHIMATVVPDALERGAAITEVIVERLGIRTPNEIDARAQAGRARTLGRDGLVLQYLEVLRKMAESPSTTILLPADLDGDPATILKAAKAVRS